MCHKTNMQNHLGLVWLNESLPKSLLFTVLGEGSFLSPVFMRMNYLEVSQKSRGMFLLPAGQLRANETTLDFHKTGNYQQLSNSQPQNYSWTKLWTLEVSSGSKTQWFSYFTQFKPSWNESRFPYPEEKQTYICSFMVTLIFSPHNFIPFSHCSGTACLRKSSLVKTMSKIRQYYLLPLPPSTQWSHPSSPHNSVLINQCFQ